MGAGLGERVPLSFHYCAPKGRRDLGKESDQQKTCYVSIVHLGFHAQQSLWKLVESKNLLASVKLNRQAHFQSGKSMTDTHFWNLLLSFSFYFIF